MNAKTLASLFRGLMTSTALGAPAMYLACGGSVASTGDGGQNENDGATTGDGADDGSAFDAISFGDGGCLGCPPPPNDAGVCTVTVMLPPGDGGVPAATCQKVCATCSHPGPGACTIVSQDAGVASVVCNGVTGRRPAGYAPSRGRIGSVGAWLARAAELEAASVFAFEGLRKELRAHGAPRRLLDGCTRAARDERKHARTMTGLARAYGSTRSDVTVPLPKRPRSLAVIAVENAREGCVRETFGALLAHVQAARSDDPRVRRAMTRIARDETRHAALAWRVHGWASTRLDARGRRRVERAAEDARRELMVALASTAEDALAPTLGLPSAGEARSLARGLGEALPAS